ncbi:MAG TPA: class I SAM-dependent methyltransferase [Vicinamibacteria bacterium]|nr:class I SAM-dependent methyltransferase [Vicinamibacteria bacterium]
MSASAPDRGARSGGVREGLRERLRRTALFPRWINTVHVEPLLTRVRGRARGTLLDVGCGRRPFERMFAGQVTRYLGMDWPSRDDRAYPDVVGNALALPLRSASVDTVLATELMEHLPSPDVFLSEVARVMRRPGTLILTVPFMEPLHEEPRDFFRFTPHGLRALLERHGFAVEEVLPKGGWWSVVVGSFVSQALYEWANPEGRDGRRRDNPLALALVVPVCSLAQVLAYVLDRVFRSRRYTLGYVVLATAPAPGAAC